MSPAEPEGVVIGMGPHQRSATIGKHIANRLLADGEQVVDVPWKLSARARVFATGQGSKTDATRAHSARWWAPG